MANQEKTTFNSHEQVDSRGLEDAGDAQREAIREDLERHQEREQDSLESARHDALEQAARPEHERRQETKKNDTPERERSITKKDKEQSFTTTMREVRSQMSPANRTFSKIIHQPAVEKVSDTIGSTIARPNAILSGSLCAFILTAAFYLIARFNGYPLSGSEAIASFALGWLIGLIIDYIRLLFVGKR
jgi:preprotein translocase subunit SecF